MTMSTIFDKNMEALSLHQIAAYELMKLELGEGSIQIGHEDIEGRKVLYGIKEEQLYQLDSMYSSEELLKVWEEQVNGLYNSKYVMFGFGNGMYARRILKMMDASSVFVLYEPDCRAFKYVLQHFDVSSILADPRLILLFPETEVIEWAEGDLYYITAKNLEYTDIDGLRILSYTNYERLYPEQYEYFSRQTSEIIASMRANRSVMNRFGEAFVKNSFHNAPYLAKSMNVYSLKEKVPEGCTAIIVSSGPSLSKNVEQLKKAKGKAILAAADSAVSVLLNHDIVPDIFFCVDAKKNPGHFTNPVIRDIPLGCDIDTTEVAIEGHKAPLLFERGQNPHINEYLEKNGIVTPKLKSGGSVANTIMSFMLEIGIESFILVGQDLAYTGDKSHAEGSLRASWNMDLSINECYVEGIDGEQIRSSHEFVTYRNWFERKIASRPDIKVINATEGGARIHGTQEMTLEEAIAGISDRKVDFADILAAADVLMNDEQQKAFADYMGKVRDEIHDLENDINKGLRIYENMKEMVLLRKYQNNQFKKLFLQTQEISERLNSAAAMYYIECMVQQEMTEVMDRSVSAREDERAELLEGIENSIDYYRIVKKGAELVKELL